MKKQNYSTGLFILRVSFGIMLLLHGISKLSGGVGFIKQNLAGNGIPEFFAYAVYLGEVVGPLMVIIGLRTKIGALLMTVNMIVAILLVHASQIFALTDNGAWAIEKPALFLFGALTLVFSGGGNFAVSRSSWWD